MNRVLKIGTVLITVFILAGLILPADIFIKRRIEIQASPEQVHYYVDNLAMWPLWSPWLELDPNIQIILGQPESGVGASQQWHDDNGGGRLIFTKSHPSQGIQYDLYIANSSEKYAAKMNYRVINETVTEVSWIMSGKMATPIIGAYLALAADIMIGDDFEQGLKQLKQVVEQKPE